MDLEELEITLKMLGINYLKIVSDIYVNNHEFDNNNNLKSFFLKILITSNLSYQMLYFTDNSYGIYITEKKVRANGR
jgi:hypothetical protein